MRTLVIGDIHGSAKALQQCLDRANVTKDDIIIQLGDVADGWSETSECVDILLNLQKTNECHFIRGNHDVWVYDWLKHGKTPIMWTQQGGQSTLDSYTRTGEFISNNHKDFWIQQKDYYIDNQNRLFIHGGWHTNIKIKDYLVDSRELDYLDIFNFQATYPVNAGSIAKECHWDRSLLNKLKLIEHFKNKGQLDYNKKLQNEVNYFKEIYIGHTSTRSHLPEKYHNLWNLDTGCGWHGKLTIMDIDTKEYWQSDYSKDLYPNEKGR